MAFYPLNSNLQQFFYHKYDGSWLTGNTNAYDLGFYPDFVLITSKGNQRGSKILDKSTGTEIITTLPGDFACANISINGTILNIDASVAGYYDYNLEFIVAGKY